MDRFSSLLLILGALTYVALQTVLARRLGAGNTFILLFHSFILCFVCFALSLFIVLKEIICHAASTEFILVV